MPAEFAPFGAFLVATACGLGLTWITFLVSRKAGLAPVQAALIDTLQDNTEALKDRVKQLEDQLARETQKRIQLEQAMARLRDGMSDLASENSELRRKLGIPRNGDHL